MFDCFLNEVVKSTRPINSTAAGTSAVNGSVIDMTGFNAVRFTAVLGTLTATQVTALKAQQGNAANGSDMADIAGAVTPAAADADSNKLLMLDVNVSKITKRYVRPVVTRRHRQRGHRRRDRRSVSCRHAATNAVGHHGQPGHAIAVRARFDVRRGRGGVNRGQLRLATAFDGHSGADLSGHGPKAFAR